MNKSEFLEVLGRRVRGLPPKDLEKTLDLYGGWIDERAAQGMTEEKAVSLLGPIDDIVETIMRKTSIFKLFIERLRPKRKPKAWQIVLLIITGPVWLPIQLLGLLLIPTAFVLLWLLILAVCALLAASAGAGVVTLIVSIGQIFVSRVSTSAFYLGASAICIGVALILFYAAIGAVTKGLRFTVNAHRDVKRKLIGGAKRR